MSPTYCCFTDVDIFRAVSFSKNTYALRKVNSPISYTRYREILLEGLNVIGLDSKLFGLHSLRSGGATVAASRDVKDRLFKRHGRWVTDIAKDSLESKVKDSLESRLSVTLNLGF